MCNRCHLSKLLGKSNHFAAESVVTLKPRAALSGLARRGQGDFRFEQLPVAPRHRPVEIQVHRLEQVLGHEYLGHCDAAWVFFGVENLHLRMPASRERVFVDNPLADLLGIFEGR